MQHIGRHFCAARSTSRYARFLNKSKSPVQYLPGIQRLTRQFATDTVPRVPHLVAQDLIDSQHLHHVRDVHNHLKHEGILKISLNFPDDNSRYLASLIVSLSKNHGHGLPITHSASRGWFWDVRPSETTFQTENHQARSETMQEFPWHTDCSYEHAPPRFFALQVLQPDRYGGGTLSVMKIDRLSQFLSPAAKAALHEPEYQITIPPEFIKNPDQRHIVGSLFALDTQDRGHSLMMRYRDEIVTPLSARAAAALKELRAALQDLEALAQSTLHLTPADLPARSIILLDNYRWLHARNSIKDPARHLRRVRWNAIPFANSVVS
ncbi:hypothetical protein BDV32DRAFT_145568 [Aspergillus pseudonomiae]|uniref:TauD/TfdA-like domain-containing protein n=1 Tax=Aspergillus pseudonomiae TaxID=1506151 RepID=A0A5N6IC61_9EURO|nr:uncharacterized protein BDV37DRAFT_278140 [Aspergillus pseudonomiae]KAB8264321.1 hypothetical protein BDV32DRAFT_145568 [Aspergillus pseudonomiae]KAE8409170.1 hypothetical protein BDV37DRAFT_278140 [Aspergillus pseudonomiae]